MKKLRAGHAYPKGSTEDTFRIIPLFVDIMRSIILKLVALLVLSAEQGESIKVRRTRSNVFTRKVDKSSKGKKGKKSAKEAKKKFNEKSEEDTLSPSTVPSISPAPSLAPSLSTTPPSCGTGMECDDPAPKVDGEESATGALSLFGAASESDISSEEETALLEPAPPKDYIMDGATTNETIDEAWWDGAVGTFLVAAQSSESKTEPVLSSNSAPRPPWIYSMTSICVLVVVLAVELT